MATDKEYVHILQNKIKKVSMKLVDRIIRKIDWFYNKAKLKDKIDFYSKRFSKKDLVFDIGANAGNRIDPFIKIGAKVIAVEPNPKLANKLKNKYASKVDVIQKAIGNREEIIDLYINDTDVLSTTSKEFIEKAKKTGRFGELSNKFNESVKVEMIPMKYLFEEYGYPVFLKIDVEGLEYEILKTLIDTKVDKLSFEFAIPETIEDVLLSIKHLQSIGYKRFNISFGESMEFITNTNMEYNDFKRLIKQLPKMSWGDIYVFNK